MGYTILEQTGRFLAQLLTKPSPGYEPFAPIPVERLLGVLEPGDIILVEGHQYVSSAIKYLTMSTWSHAAMYVGDALPEPKDGSERPRIVEVNLGEGCVAAPLSKYRFNNTRVCRASGLTEVDRAEVVDFMIGHLGTRYDLRNIFDLLRYFFPTPPVPVRWRRRLLHFGSGDPTRAICSSLIAQAFQSIGYPILPKIRVEGEAGDFIRREVFLIRHHSRYTPRDFDLSPYFEVVKPTLASGFDHHEVIWDTSAEVAR